MAVIPYFHAEGKVTITLDRDKARAAQELVGAGSTSAVIDVALDRLLREQRVRRDVAAYRRLPPTGEEPELADHGDVHGLADDTDWEALYPEGT